jgi:hypothetical protein
MRDRRGISDRVNTGDLRSLYERVSSPPPERGGPQEEETFAPEAQEREEERSESGGGRELMKATYYIREDQSDWLAEAAFRERKLKGGRGISDLVREAIDLLREVEDSRRGS